MLEHCTLIFLCTDPFWHFFGLFFIQAVSLAFLHQVKLSPSIVEPQTVHGFQCATSDLSCQASPKHRTYMYI